MRCGREYWRFAPFQCFIIQLRTRNLSLDTREPARSSFFDSIFWFSLGSTLLYTVALPPLNFWPLVFFVPFLWGIIIVRTAGSIRIPNEKPPEERRSFFTRFIAFWSRTFKTVSFKMYFSGVLFWLLNTWWICYPHFLTGIGWVLLACYLGIYWLLFLKISVYSYVKCGIPVCISAPIAWCAMEFFRKTLMGGFTFCSLEHALYLQPLLIQSASIWGEFGVGFLIVMIGTVPVSLVFVVKEKRTGQRITAIACGLIAVTLLLLAGNFGAKLNPNPDSPPNIAVLQGEFSVYLGAPEKHYMDTFDKYIELSKAAIADSEQPLDLIVWPETVYPYPVISRPEGESADPLWLDMMDAEDAPGFHEAVEKSNEYILLLAKHIGRPVLFGASRWEFEPGKEFPARYNSAVLVTSEKIGRHYDKMHLVMFGEYIPFSEYLPENLPFRSLCPDSRAGKNVTIFTLENGSTVLANICFESSAPQMIRKQCNNGETVPDFLVNLSNDGWFMFSSQIDLHLATHVFRAVENRRSYLFATNGGFSGWIDANGNIVRKGERGTSEYVLCTPENKYTGKSVYGGYGEWLPILCVIAVVFIWLYPSRSSHLNDCHRKKGAFQTP